MSALYYEAIELIRQLKNENIALKAEVERLTKQNALATPRHLIASQDITSLREQVERLTKAEEMSGNNLKRCNCQECEDARKELRARIALKKGGQP